MSEKIFLDSTRIEDTYFSNFADAKVQAQQQLFLDHGKGKLQLCFYDGRKQEEYGLPNLINLPISMIPNFFVESDFRIPTNIIHCRKEEVEDKIFQAEQKRTELLNILLQKIKKQDITLNGKPRIYFSVDYNGKVVENIYRLLESAFKSNGWETYFDINDSTSLMDDYKRARSIFKFKPNVVFTINRFRSGLINQSTFHFSWYMDPTLNLYDDSSFTVRHRDFFFYLIENFRDALINKGIPPKKLDKQSFACDPAFINHSRNKKKEDKVVFIGNDYFKVCDPTYKYAKSTTLINLVTELFESKQINNSNLDTFATKLLNEGLIKRKEHFEMYIFPAVVRVQVLKWLCEVSPIPIEIYGDGWENYPEINQYHKGTLTSKEAVIKICCHAKYSLLAHPEYFYQQRLLESSACGSIPVIYVGQNNREEFHHYNSSLIFTTKSQLKDMLTSEPTLPPNLISKELTYDSIVKSVEEKIRSIELDSYQLINSAEVFDV